MNFDRIFTFLSLFVFLGMLSVIVAKKSQAPAVLSSTFNGLSGLMKAAKA